MASAAAGMLFGAGDQYLGSLSRLSWSWQVAGVSAPWLVLPFLVGAIQRTGRRAAWAGGTSAMVAVAAYIAMILSPMEGVHLSDPVAQILATTRSQSPWLLGAAVVAPVYGWVGHRWKASHAPWCLAIAVATVCLEPAARVLTGRLQPDPAVWLGELGVGVVGAAWLFLGHREAHSGPARGDRGATH